MHTPRVPSGNFTQEVRVYFLRGEDYSEEQVRHFCEILSPEERQQAESYRVPDRRRDFICLHVLVRVLLAQVLHIGIRQLRFSRAQGRFVCTQAEEAGISFNLSYARGLAICAISPTGTLGVDLERIQELPDLDLLAASVLSDREIRLLKSASTESGKLGCFYTLWTLKEAYLKALGIGITVPLREVTFDVEELKDADAGSVTRVSKKGSLACSYFREESYVGSVVSSCDREAPLQISLFRSDRADWLLRGLPSDSAKF